MKLKLLKILRFFHLIDKETYNKKRALLLIVNSEYFDEVFYRNEHNNVDFSKISPAEHYLTIGYKKGYNPSAYFSTDNYLTENPDVKEKEQNPLLHYEICGKKEGRNKGYSDDCKYRMSLRKYLGLKLLSGVGKILYHQEIEKNQHIRILVCLHLYYMSAWPIIRKYLENLSSYQYDLIVTYIGTNHNLETLKQIKTFKPNTKFHAFSNQGYDVGSFMDVLQKIDLNAYDVIFKIHSKGAQKPLRFIYNQVFKCEDWFYNLINGILSGINCHKIISLLTSKNDIGMIAAKNLITIDPLHKQKLTQNFATKLNVELPKPYHYVAGTMFAIRSECLKKIKSLNLNIENFKNAKRGDFSFAHAMERIICAMVEKNNYRILGLNTPHNPHILQKYRMLKESPLRLLKDNRFEIDEDFFYKTLENRCIKKYDVHKIRIGDINRKWIDGNLYKLKDCSPYQYLLGDKQRYKNYCQTNNEKSPFEMSEERFNNLIRSMDTGYNPKQMPIICGENNTLLDGQHRLCFLLKKYGEDYEVDCLHIDNTERYEE